MVFLTQQIHCVNATMVESFPFLAQLSCKDIKDNDKTAENGVYLLASGGREFQVNG